MSKVEAFSTAAMTALLGWVEARLTELPAGAAFSPLLPRSPLQTQAVAAEPVDLPVLRFWPTALPQGKGPVTGIAAEALRTLGPALRWRQNPTYRDAAFLAGYAYAEIAGPAGLIETRKLSLGVLLLAPATLYPAHRHPAEEIYLPLQPAFWQRGDAGPWQRQPGGAVIHHPSMLAHAMRTEAGALPALYLWRGDLATPAALMPLLDGR